jgi:hypothetical protein
MGRNKDLRKRIAGYEKVIARHEEKIRAELANESPNELRIAGWRREIRVWEEIVIRLSRRLNREW